MSEYKGKIITLLREKNNRLIANGIIELLDEEVPLTLLGQVLHTLQDGTVTSLFNQATEEQVTKWQDYYGIDEFYQQLPFQTLYTSSHDLLTEEGKDYVKGRVLAGTAEGGGFSFFKYFLKVSSEIDRGDYPLTQEQFDTYISQGERSIQNVKNGSETKAIMNYLIRLQKGYNTDLGQVSITDLRSFQLLLHNPYTQAKASDIKIGDLKTNTLEEFYKKTEGTYMEMYAKGFAHLFGNY